MLLPPSLADALTEPPRAYSPVSIWWWSGERLDAARLRWQLDRFAEGGVYNLVILNLAPSGPLYGCDADDPPFFSEPWWDLFLGVCDEAKRLGISLWFYDQLGFSGADLQARLVARRPEFAGRRLYRSAPPAGARPVTATVYEGDHGFDYLSGAACATLLDEVHGEFARRLGEHLGTVVVGSFQDELPALPTWSAGFADAFAERYGYDLLPRLGALWGDDVPETGGVRRDYHALRAALAEEAFFRPLAAWHAEHGLLVGCDQQDPARSGHPVEGVQLYGDYARTHRWFSAPGSDHHGDARIHSSLAHLYGGSRTWIEAFHSTGWGGTLEETLDWLLPWLRTGATLYNPHAVYYSTRAGWWEWAPPGTDFRQPYWRHYRAFADAVARMCAALSLGRHVCDVAVLYPVATAQAETRLDGVGEDGTRAQQVYRDLIGDATWFAPRLGALDAARLDADVIDEDSLSRAAVVDARLVVAGESYAAVILPAATVLAEATASRLDEFVDAGGRLVAVGAIPSRAAEGDAADAVIHRLRDRFSAGTARLVASVDEVAAALDGVELRIDAELPVLAREVDGALSVFVTAAEWSATQIVGTPGVRGVGGTWADAKYEFDPARYHRTVVLRVRDAPGPPMLASPFGATPRPLPYTVNRDVTRVVVPLEDGPAAFVVFAAGAPVATTPAATSAAASSPADSRGEQVAVEGDWDVEPIATLDNTWGDLALPPSSPSSPTVIERWGIEHRVDGTPDWSAAVATFGPHGLADGTTGPTELSYSDSRGIHKDPIHRWTLGPKGHVPEEFLDFGVAPAGHPVDLRATFETREASVTVAVGAPAGKQLRIDGTEVELDDRGGHLATAPVTLAAGAHELHLRLTPDSELHLRAHLAFVRDVAAYRRPEWIEVPGARKYGTTARLATPPTSALATVTAIGSARLRVNGVEVGRHGGFEPYERPVPLLRRYDLAGALRAGDNELIVELTEPSAVLVDGLLGELAVVSDDDWWADVDDGRRVSAARHRRTHRSLTDLYLRRRPHPLPAAGWLDDDPRPDTVLPITLAVPRPGGPRTEWLRFVIPPGATRVHATVHGDADLLIEGLPAARGTGAIEVALPAGGRQGLLRIRTRPGYEAGAALAGPLRFTVGPGRMGLGDWTKHGLAEYSGGVRYQRRINVPPGAWLLDLGRVRGTAEVFCAGNSAGARFCAPYIFPLTPGDHQVTVEVYGTLAPYLDAVSPTRFILPGQTVSGLLGPVVLRRQQEHA